MKKVADDSAPEQITPEMIKAGALVLAGFDTTFADEELWAKRVYLAMRRAAFFVRVPTN